MVAGSRIRPHYRAGPTRGLEHAVLVLAIYLGGIGPHFETRYEMDPVKEKIVDVLVAIIFVALVAAIAWPKEAKAGDVYMQMFSEKEARGPVRSLSKDARMSLEECQENKRRVEKPLSAGGGYSIPSGWKVECVPVEYLDD